MSIARRVGAETATTRRACSIAAALEVDDFAERGGNGGADPGRAHGAIRPAGADVRADHGDERAAQSENQRNKQIFEPRTGAITGDGGWTEGADEAGGNGDRQIGLHRDQRRDRADAQNIGEQRPAETDPAKF